MRRVECSPLFDTLDRAKMSLSLEGHAEILPPIQESVAALEHTHKLLQEAVAALDNGDEEQLVLAYEHASECADNIARALWFLHRAAKDGEVSAAAASSATATGSQSATAR